MSLSRKVRENDCIQRVHCAADRASQARGKPPRIQRRSWFCRPTSASEKPPTSTKIILPARVSEIPWIKSQEALPSSRKTAFRFRSSQIGRRISNRPGMRCTSSRTTRPSLWRSSLSGVADNASRTVATSRSRTVDGPDQSDATCSARVVLPTCLAPSKATTGTWESPLTTSGEQIGTGNILLHITLSTDWISNNKCYLE